MIDQDTIFLWACFLFFFAFLGFLVTALAKVIKKKKSAIVFIILAIVFGSASTLTFNWLVIKDQKAKQLIVEVEKIREKERQRTAVGMTDTTRKQIFWDLVELQDSFMKKYPYDNQKQQEAYKTIAKKYGILESVVRQIAVRGIKECWPQPPLK